MNAAGLALTDVELLASLEKRRFRERFKARHRATGDLLEATILNLDTGDPGVDASLAFARETAYLAAVDDPLFPGLYGHGVQEAGKGYLLTEHVPGRPLSDYALASVPEVIRLSSQLALGLVALERAGFGARQLVFEGFLVGEAGVPRLVVRELAGVREAGQMLPGATAQMLGFFLREWLWGQAERASGEPLPRTPHVAHPKERGSIPEGVLELVARLVSENPERRASLLEATAELLDARRKLPVSPERPTADEESLPSISLAWHDLEPAARLPRLSGPGAPRTPVAATGEIARDLAERSDEALSRSRWLFATALLVLASAAAGLVFLLL
ncbi:MAG: hypothetical protein JNK60_00400 [Acidobacteria bacterium]|nr:hypothetical protein [Acidobacteriota bacterium]